MVEKLTVVVGRFGQLTAPHVRQIVALVRLADHSFERERRQETIVCALRELLLTAYAGDFLARELLESGFGDFFLREMVQTIESILARDGLLPYALN
jgi:hypothetical protein